MTVCAMFFNLFLVFVSFRVVIIAYTIPFSGDWQPNRIVVFCFANDIGIVVLFTSGDVNFCFGNIKKKNSKQIKNYETKYFSKKFNSIFRQYFNEF